MIVALAFSLALFWPLAVALRGPWRRAVILDAIWLSAPLPALALALWPAELAVTPEGWLLGGDWRLDAFRRPWLAFTALLWGLAGLYARGYLDAEQRDAEAGNKVVMRRLQGLALLWPLTLCGNLMLILAEDIPSFYLGFVTMTLAAYGLVVHTRRGDAWLGGRAYLVMAMLGEALILSGLLWGAGFAEALTLGELRAGIAEAEHGVWIATLLWLGFGVKAGVAGLHVWLPLAHPVAPTPASAVLSGVMIKAGILGWLGTLPLGVADAGLESLGRVVVATGLVGAFAAALLGVCQRHPKAVLAYSSVSQMGMLSALLGMGLVAPTLWPVLAPATALFAAHHGMTKGALFLGVGISEHPPRLPPWLLWTLLAVPALSLSGALASGLAAKWAMKEALHEGDHKRLVLWLSLAAVGTTLLMARALWRQWRVRGVPELAWRSPMPLAWLASVVFALIVPLWLPLAGHGVAWPPPGELLGLLWPLALGIAVAGGVLGAARIYTWRLPVWSEPGDLWWGYASLARRGLQAVGRGVAALESRVSRLYAWLVRSERRFVEALAGLPRYERYLRRLAVPLTVGVALALLAGFWLQ